MHTTQKSHKDQTRDKPKHSNKDIQVTKKGGAGGRGTWGNPKDDIKYMNEDDHAMDNEDPNYDPTDQHEDPGSYQLKAWTPTEERKTTFSNNMTDLNAYKRLVKDACKEWLVSHDEGEFIGSITEAKYTLFHQDLPAILVKYSLDKSDAERQLICKMLQTLNKQNIVTAAQMTQGFSKLYHGLDELIVDAPNAKTILSEFVNHGTGAGYVDGTRVAQMESEALELLDLQALGEWKKKIKSIVKEYFTSNLVDELTSQVKALKPAFHFEVVKQLVSLSMDLTGTEREKANMALASLVGTAISSEQAVKGVTILLGRVEDIYLDVPDVLYLLSCIIARMTIDEALPPAFLLRVDLCEADMGFQVATQAQVILSSDNAAARLETVWGYYD